MQRRSPLSTVQYHFSSSSCICIHTKRVPKEAEEDGELITCRRWRIFKDTKLQVDQLCLLLSLLQTYPPVWQQQCPQKTSNNPNAQSQPSRKVLILCVLPNKTFQSQPQRKSIELIKYHGVNEMRREPASYSSRQENNYSPRRW